MITVLFIFVLVAILVWWLVAQRLTEKPWETVSTLGNVQQEQVLFRQPTNKLGLVIFITVITSFFSLFVSAYMMRMMHGDWQPLAEPGLLWVNTAVLLGSSITLQIARGAARYERSRSTKIALLLTGVLTITFLVGQLIVWRQLNSAGMYVQANPSYAFFYLLTGLHGLHLAGGLAVWARSVIRMLRGAPHRQISQSVQLCTLYWHYLFVVWLVIFALLLLT